MRGLVIFGSGGSGYLVPIHLMVMLLEIYIALGDDVIMNRQGNLNQW